MAVIERWSSHIGWSQYEKTLVVYIYCTVFALKKLSCLVFALKELSCLLLSDVSGLSQNNGLFNEIAVLLSETVL